jgi:hypothetical protein
MSINFSFADARDVLQKVSMCWAPPEFMRIDAIDYAEKYVNIATEDSPPLIIPFRRNPVQSVYHNLKNKIEKPRSTGKRILTLKSRRMGVTTYEQAMSYSMARTQRGAQCLTVAQTKEATVDIFKMVKLMHDDDKNYMRLSTDKKDGLAYKNLKSSFTITTALGLSIKRGATLHKSHGTEVAFWELNEQDALNLISAIDAATRGGEVVLETTANGTSGVFYDLWQEATSQESKWSPIFLGWYLDARNSVMPLEGEREQILDTLDDEELVLVDKFNCNIGQLAWRREQTKGGEKSKRQFRQEYPATAEEAFISSGMSYFEVDVLERLMRLCADPIRETEGLSIWKEPVAGRRYILAADTSEGLTGSDPSPIVVLEYETCEQVYRLNWCVRPNVLARKCAEVAQHYNNAIIAIENNNTGHAALEALINQLDYRNVYYHEDEVREEAKTETRPGWRTDGKTKPVLLGDLEIALKENTIKVNDKLFLTQCRSFKDLGNGRATSKAKEHHGDTVIAWGIALQVRKSSQTIQEPIFV